MKDAWGRTIEYVRLSLTDACNFCCPYCRPAEITPQSQTQLLSVDEWMNILGAFHHIGVKAVRLTGGEPLLYPHIEELLGRIKETGWFEDISMTTNGSLLASRAQRLKKLGLNRVNISLDSLETEAFATCVGKEGQLESVLDGIRSAINANFKSVKINTVLSRYWSDDEVKSLDISILQDNILDEILGIKDPRRDKRIDFVGGIRGIDELEKRANSDMEVAFAMYPTGLDELIAVADANKIMPAKSTWFEPKVRCGLFLHELD